jgi:hypothetical protein
MKLIGLLGAARSGKDTVAKILADVHGFHVVSTGFHIKKRLDPAIQSAFGFSAHTEIDKEKDQIRTTLQAFGNAARAVVEHDLWNEITVKSMADQLDNRPSRFVNTRLIEADECQRWLERGGTLWRIIRPGKVMNEFEEKQYNLLLSQNPTAISEHIMNSGSVNDLTVRVIDRSRVYLP